MPTADFSYRSLDSLILEVLPSVRSLRHDLHQHPELGYKETRTSARVRAELAGLKGFTVRTGLAETGLVATLGAELDGPAVALRADMDALPITEITGAAYASQTPGVMHACGHDGHTAMLVGAAKVLARIADELQGPVRLIFQPAEEGGAGGRRMVEEGALDNPAMAAVFGLHNMPTRETRAGQLCLCPGAAMAGGSKFEVVIRGRGGHAAAPHLAVDPIFVGSQVIVALQGIVSRGTDPIRCAVVSVTEFHAGTTFNIIPETATLRGTIRALEGSVMEETIARFEQQVKGVVEALGARAEISVVRGYPPVYNHPRTSGFFKEVVMAIGRGGDYLEVPPIMGSEDFAYYQEKIPGSYWYLASRPESVPDVPYCHDPRFDFNDEVLADGIRLHVEIARRFARAWTPAS